MRWKRREGKRSDLRSRVVKKRGGGDIVRGEWKLIVLRHDWAVTLDRDFWKHELTPRRSSKIAEHCIYWLCIFIDTRSPSVFISLNLCHAMQCHAISSTSRRLPQKGVSQTINTRIALSTNRVHAKRHQSNIQSRPFTTTTTTTVTLTCTPTPQKRTISRCDPPTPDLSMFLFLQL